MPKAAKLTFRNLDESDVNAFRDIRLESLKKYPENFTSSYEHEKGQPESFFLDMVHNCIFMGCFNEGDLLGICGFKPYDDRPTTAHKGIVTGFYIRKKYRGRGFAKKLMKALLEQVDESYEQALIRVTTDNYKVHKMYRSLGFKDIGVEKRSFKVNGKYKDEAFMVKFF